MKNLKFLKSLTELSITELKNQDYIYLHVDDNYVRYSDDILMAMKGLVDLGYKKAIKEEQSAHVAFNESSTPANYQHFNSKKQLVRQYENALSRINYKTFGRNLSTAGKNTKLLPLGDLIDSPILTGKEVFVSQASLQKTA